MKQEILEALSGGAPEMPSQSPPAAAPAPLKGEPGRGDPCGHPGDGRLPASGDPPERAVPSERGPGETEDAPAGGDAPDSLPAAGRDADAVFAHLDGLRAQAAALREEFPDFDLDAALRDPAFLRLTAPGTGVDLRRAYYALHRDALDARAARRAAEETRQTLARTLAAGGLRPREGGGQEAPAALAADYRALSRPEQQKVKQRILEAAARGEKIYP